MMKKTITAPRRSELLIWAAALEKVKKSFRAGLKSSPNAKSILAKILSKIDFLQFYESFMMPLTKQEKDVRFWICFFFFAENLDLDAQNLVLEHSPKEDEFVKKFAKTVQIHATANSRS